MKNQMWNTLTGEKQVLVLITFQHNKLRIMLNMKMKQLKKWLSIMRNMLDEKPLVLIVTRPQGQRQLLMTLT